MSPVLFISLPFVFMLLLSRLAAAAKAPQDKNTKPPEYQDGDIIIIRRQSRKKP